MNWPSHTDYQDAMQNPGVCFQEPELKGGEPRLDPLGLPRVMSGNFASVYELKTEQGRWAIRCFVRQIPGQQGRYARLSQYLNSVSMPYLVGFEYMLRGILVKGEWYPIVKMQWVEGSPLNTWVEDNVNNPDALRKLAADWRVMLKTLHESKIAHGDLQHGNIMVTPDNELRLVDYDGMYCPVFGRGRAPELGHINFQHPRRTADFYQEDLDNFAALVIHTSLLALAADPSLWDTFYTVDNLIVTSADFKNPMNSKVFAALKKSSDPAVPSLVALLEKCCVSQADCVPDYEDVMAALDSGTLDQLPMKTPAAAPALSMSRPAPPEPTPAAGPTGTRPAPATGTRPAPQPAAGPTGTRPASSMPLPRPQGTASFGNKSSQSQTMTTAVPQKEGGGMPKWIWAVVGLVILVIALMVFVLRTSQSTPPAAEEEPTTPATEAPADAPTTAAPAPAPAPIPPAPAPAMPPASEVKLGLMGTLKGHAGSVDTLVFWRDSKTLASGSADKTVKLWDIESGQPKSSLAGASDTLTGLNFFPDGKTVYGVEVDNVLLYWNTGNGSLIRKAAEYKNNLFLVAISPDAMTLATGTSDRKVVQLIDLQNSVAKKSLPKHSSWVRSVSFSSDSRLLAVVCHDDSITVWDATTALSLQNLSSPGNSVDAAAFSKDNKWLATGNDVKGIKIWDLATGQAKLTLNEHTEDVKCFAFSPDGQYLVSGSLDKSVKLWDLNTGEAKFTATGHTGPITAVAFSPNGKLVATGSADQTVRLWELRQ